MERDSQLLKFKEVKINMKQEDKQLLLKDLCSRLPYGVTCYNSDTESDFELSDISDIDTDYPIFDYGYGGIETIKPYLRPMSSMTEKERDEYKSFIFDYEYDDYWHPGEYTDAVDMDEMSELIDWLNAHHFDYRNLIKCGLALPAPEGMYKF